MANNLMWFLECWVRNNFLCKHQSGRWKPSWGHSRSWSPYSSSLQTFYPWRKVWSVSVWWHGSCDRWRWRRLLNAWIINYLNQVGNEMFLVERAGRVMGRFLTEAGDVYFIEPCNNWEGCHVWKHYNAQDIFVQEVEELDTEMKVKHMLASKSVL